MSAYTISRNDLKRICAFGDVRVKNLLNTPRKLLFSANAGPSKEVGRSTQFYRLIDLLPRLREKYSAPLFTPAMELELVALDQRRRQEWGNV